MPAVSDGITAREINKPPNGWEWWFIVYGLGFTLDKVCSTLEHGWKGTLRQSTRISKAHAPAVFASNLWNGLDALFCVTFLSYLILLCCGEFVQHHNVLSCAAIFLLPRLVTHATRKVKLMTGNR